MKTEVSEIADNIYRLSTFVPQIGPNGFTFNQFLIDAAEPLLFHYGQRSLFPLISDAVKRVVPLNKLRWTTCSHVEADESGALNQWLAAAPNASTLFCSDLFTQMGPHTPTTESDIVEPAIAVSDRLPYMPPTALIEPTLRRLAALKPTTIALMHGPAFKGDGAAALSALADHYAKRLAN